MSMGALAPLEAGLLEPRVDEARQAVPGRDGRSQQRVDLRLRQLEAALLCESQGLTRRGDEAPAQLLVRHQPSDHDLDAALTHRLLRFGTLRAIASSPTTKSS